MMNKVNKRWIMMIGLIAVVATGAAFLFFSHDPAQAALEETRRALRQQGFKIAAGVQPAGHGLGD